MAGEQTVTVCGVHEDTVNLLAAIKDEMATNNVETAKLRNSLGWIKWVMTGVLGLSATVLLAVIPFIVNMHTRIVVLEKSWEKVSYEASYGKSPQINHNITKQ